MATTATTPLDELLAGWQPVPSGLTELQRLHASALNAGVAERCPATLDAEAAARLDRLAPALTQSGWTTPDLAFAYYVEAAPDVLAQLEAVAARPDPPPVRLTGLQPEPAWVVHVLGEFQAIQRTADPFVVAGTPDDHRQAADALSQLRSAWPEMAFAVDRLARVVVWFSNPWWRQSGTHGHAFGALFVSTGRGLPGTLEALVHEVTHHELLARASVDPQIVNDTEIESPPSEEGPRPLIGILHAALVSRRTGHALRRCAATLGGDDRDAAADLARAADRRLGVALTSLERQARWTAVGSRLFESLRRDRHPSA